jgi:8-amino-7-oxononanoate synthase
VADVMWDAWVEAELTDIRLADRWRQVRPLDGAGVHHRLPDGRPVVTFASNDYLGLSCHPGVKAAARAAVDRWGTGAGSSRLVVGDRPVHTELEATLAEWRGTPAALVFPTGYHANLAALTTFGTGARIVSDELNHASIIDGARLARAEVTIYRHGDVEQAARLVEGAPGRAVVVSDTVFSMDGDVAPVAELSEVCARSGAMLILDDAHVVWEYPVVDPGCHCLRVGTLSKALGAQGGYIAGPRPWIDLMVNRARPFVFTTGLAPASAAAGSAAIAICRSPEGARLRDTLRRHVDAVRPGHPSPIVPIVLGEESAALAAAARLQDGGLLVPAIRPPTVPDGTARLRVSLSAIHSGEEVGRLVDALAVLAGS